MSVRKRVGGAVPTEEREILLAPAANQNYEKMLPATASSNARLSGLALWWQFIRQTGSNVRKSKVNYCLGFTACFVVVFVVALLVSVLAKAPIIYLRLGELNNGEVDVQLNAAPFTGYARFNYSLVAELLAQNDAKGKYSYHTPRIHLGLYILAANSCRVRADPYDPTWKYRPPSWDSTSTCGERPTSCMWNVCPSRLGVTVRLPDQKLHFLALHLIFSCSARATHIF
jgi:hypothetical protein